MLQELDVNLEIFYLEIAFNNANIISIILYAYPIHSWPEHQQKLLHKKFSFQNALIFKVVKNIYLYNSLLKLGKILKSQRTSKWKASVSFNMRLQWLSSTNIVIWNICGFVNIIIQYSKIKNQIFKLVSEENTRNFSFFTFKIIYIYSDFTSCPALKPYY